MEPGYDTNSGRWIQTVTGFSFNERKRTVDKQWSSAGMELTAEELGNLDFDWVKVEIREAMQTTQQNRWENKNYWSRGATLPPHRVMAGSPGAAMPAIHETRWPETRRQYTMPPLLHSTTQQNRWENKNYWPRGATLPPYRVMAGSPGAAMPANTRNKMEGNETAIHDAPSLAQHNTAKQMGKQELLAQGSYTATLQGYGRLTGRCNAGNT
jgi:hypothetical protein